MWENYKPLGDIVVMRMDDAYIGKSYPIPTYEPRFLLNNFKIMASARIVMWSDSLEPEYRPQEIGEGEIIQQDTTLIYTYDVSRCPLNSEDETNRYL